MKVNFIYLIPVLFGNVVEFKDILKVFVRSSGPLI